MQVKEPLTNLGADFSTPGATAVPWAVAREALEKSEIFWLSTVRPDGRPHVTPLVAVWHDGAMYFCTGRDERKNKNLEANAHCVLTTGCNSFHEGFDIVIEGDAVRVSDGPTLQRLAGLWQSKYDWPWTVRDGAFHGEEGNEALVYKVAPRVAFGFQKGDRFSQTRWRF